MSKVNDPAKMAVAITKLAKTLDKLHGIRFYDIGPNVRIIDQGGKELIIAKQCFYRESGMCMTHVDGDKKNEVIIKPITEDMWFNVQLRGIIEYNFKKMT